MATRRPKVPRATPAAPKSPATGDVIEADFGGSRGAAGHEGSNAAADGRGSGRTAGQHAGTAPSTRQAGAARRTPAPRNAVPGAATSGTGTSKAGAEAGGEHLDPVPAKAFSGRMLALLVVMIAITIMLAPTVKIFIEKRGEIAELQADISAKQSQQNELKRQVSRWQDPNYVKQQARDRINMVMPGETGYWVFGSDLPAGAGSGAAGAQSQQDPAELPWVDSLWDSIRRSATD
ncbi:septum formation initiator family protein [Pseudarthrobacter sp. PH31-O2]|uniref:FtsB family cell division protein n=1 Tax=Pseudarthrobacter sp. PH31-O2 TaxID=3046206 RepID=UPI0024B8ED58|nr:septum formation initiator family protein [Pseudarthrobacter sp. PH31-O2]MDJ0351955.1 septum formation initiator family protein [Pseudarthrobacter sp. PH31-O2]